MFRANGAGIAGFALFYPLSVSPIKFYSYFCNGFGQNTTHTADALRLKRQIQR